MMDTLNDIKEHFENDGYKVLPAEGIEGNAIEIRHQETKNSKSVEIEKSKSGVQTFYLHFERNTNSWQQIDRDSANNLVFIDKIKKWLKD